MADDKQLTWTEFKALWEWLMPLYPYAHSADGKAYWDYLQRLPGWALAGAMRQAPRRFRPHFPTAGDLESLAEDLVAAKVRQERHRQSWREHTHRDPDGAAKIRAIVHGISKGSRLE